MITKNIVWDHRGRTKAGAEGPVEIRVYHNGERFYINTGIKVRGRELRDGMIVGRQDADVLNERLAIVTERVMKAVNRCIEQGIPIDVSEVKKQVYNRAGSAPEYQGQYPSPILGACEPIEGVWKADGMAGLVRGVHLYV